MLQKYFGDKVFLKKLWKISLPLMLQSFMLAAVAAADSLMLGSLNQNSMSAVSEATQVQFIQNMFLSSVVMGCTILGAQYWGKGDKKTVSNLFCIIIRLNLIISVVFAGACILTPRFLMRIFTNEEVLISLGVRYLKIAGWSYLLTGISQCYLGIMKVTDHPSTSAWISISAVIINIVLNAVFIYGLGPLPVMDVEGAALATLISRVIELLAAVFFSHKKGYMHLDIAGLFKRFSYIMKDFWKTVLPCLGASLLWGVGFTSYTAFMGHMGTAAAAANSVAAVVRDLVCCACNGVANATGIVVGNELGAGNLEKGKLYGDRIMHLAFVIGILSTLVMFAVTPLLKFIVKLDAEASRYLTQLMLVMSVYMIGRVVNTIVINGVFYCGGDIMYDVISLITTMWMLAVPLAFLGTFVFDWPVWVVYACTCLDEVGKIPWVIVHHKKYKWVKDLTQGA